MTDTERGIRIACVSKALAAFGDVTDEMVEAIVDLTAGIPYYVPPERGESPTQRLLFPQAVIHAALSVTYGRMKPGDILAAAIEIAGKVTTPQGHSSERRWVKSARLHPQALPLPVERMVEIESGERVRLAAGGSE